MAAVPMTALFDGGNIIILKVSQNELTAVSSGYLLPVTL